MLLKITYTTDNQYIGRIVEYNDAGKVLTFPNGESINIVDEVIVGSQYILNTANYTINLITTWQR